MDLDLELINRALVSDGRPPIRRRGIATLSRALVSGVAEVADASLDPQVLCAAVLLFANQPTRYVKAAAVQIVRRVGVGPGPGPVSTREDIDGPIPILLDRTLAFIEAHTSHHEAVVGTHRETFAEYPPAVLREAILNALAHRDYALVGATVDVTIGVTASRSTALGALPGHITTENMRSEHYSRNRRIMRVLKTLNLVEEYGEGVDRMFNRWRLDSWSLHTSPPPHRR